ncbi:vegetative cell wall protein gp1-like [Vitis riparia]|uniref:vegetative cell wall protein gp1-like n=1 Tax=Vitis riparia TaxID=96939 RepID=UPI00155B00A8|nr:vegetative cell wall protein gp1-like [Vitis riparia]
MAALLYFKEKVHRKKLQQADMIPLLFLRLLCHILEHMGYPIEPHLERHHHCLEHFIPDQWTQLAERNSTELAHEAAPPKPVPPVPVPPAVSTDPPATPPISPPVPPAIPPSSQDFITISGSEFYGMIQQHLGLAPPQTDIPGPSELRAPTEETIPPVETITADVPHQATHETTSEPSCPPENPAP